MTTSINVDKRSVKQLLETGKNKRFIIPEYQRPYTWSDEQIQVLFDDLTEYTLNTTEDENNTYFLGTIVSYENQEFANILVSGKADEKSNSNYAKNYRLLQQLVNEYAADNPLSFYNFISNILNQAILLPITADSQETALTIFSTLNDRGLALSDADIFKAKIYNHLNSDEKKRIYRTLARTR